ncbi:hypothetical protein [Texcoconibacillus texcoconensis]|uniref:Uncharacterized protein n=1 Tax=Texcoconibacillus texcoconensis TaxID=1095777 RepID=A0A840QP38_9BACI|nr:hypothetical protein [Texcoconibacillus texcoconensis]MBB5173108.1 hypothetical protein [Texcoconibacillus texcoconensis]
MTNKSLYDHLNNYFQDQLGRQLTDKERKLLLWIQEKERHESA